MPRNEPRAPALRLWTGLALAATATAAAALPPTLTAPRPMASGLVWQTQGEGEGGGAADVALDTASYLAALDLMLGHLTVGTELYTSGNGEHALTHMKHPGDEIYSDLAASFAARGSAGFEAELSALAAAVEGAAAAADVDAAFGSVRAALETARGMPTPREEMDAVMQIVRVAADEYGIGVVDGALANLHEYQDAYGFLQVARARLTHLAGSGDAAVAAAAAEALLALAATDTNFPSLLAEGTLGSADVIYGAAARIELAALSLG